MDLSLPEGITDNHCQASFFAYGACRFAEAVWDRRHIARLNPAQREALNTWLKTDAGKAAALSEWEIGLSVVSEVLKPVGIGALATCVVTLNPWAGAAAAVALIGARVLKKGFTRLGFDFLGAEGRRDALITQHIQSSTFSSISSESKRS